MEVDLFRKLTIGHLEDAIDAVHAVYQEGYGAFGRLALIKGIPPTTFSTRIKRVEAELGVELFFVNDSGTRIPKITKAGHILRENGPSLLAALNVLRSKL